MTFPNWHVALNTVALTTSIAAMVGSVVAAVRVRWVWRAYRRMKAELAAVYAHRLVVTDGCSPDRDTAAVYLEIWQAVAVAKYGGAGQGRPLWHGAGGAVWFLPPAGAVDVAGVPLPAPRPRGAPPAD